MTQSEQPHRLRRLLEVTDGAPVAPLALIITFLVGLSISALLAFGVRAAARGWFDVPRNLATLKIGTLAVSVLMPVLGNCFGFLMAYRKPGRRSLLVFLAPGAVLVTLGFTILFLQLPTSPSTASLLATIAVALIPTAVIVPLLLRLRSSPRAAYHAAARSRRSCL
jgi:fucose 4-O-acetylase-like acetyltransferase